MSGWRYRALTGSLVIAAVAYLGFVLWSGWRDVGAAIAKVGAVGLAVALVLSLVNYGLRFIRWQFYLRAMDNALPWWQSLKIYLAGFALTTTPGKAGEALRGVLLKRWGMAYPKSFAAFLSERLSDLVAILLLTLFGLSVYPAMQPLVALGAAAVLTTFLAIHHGRLLERLRLRHASEILVQARRCHAPSLLAAATALSLVAWAAEAWAFHLILEWMGLDIPLAFAVSIYAVSMLAGALSFLPGGLGGAEAVMIALLAWKGVGAAEATAATLLIRLATLWFAVGIGALALATHDDLVEARHAR